MIRSGVGQLFVRLASNMDDGRKLLMLSGIVAVDKDSIVQDVLKGEHQYTVLLEEDNTTVNQLDMKIFLDGVVDHGKRFHGWTVGQILTEPIWRV